MKFDLKEFLVIGIIGVLVFGFLSNIIPPIFDIMGWLTIGEIISFGIAVYVGKYVLELMK